MMNLHRRVATLTLAVSLLAVPGALLASTKDAGNHERGKTSGEMDQKWADRSEGSRGYEHRFHQVDRHADYDRQGFRHVGYKFDVANYSHEGYRDVGYKFDAVNDREPLERYADRSDTGRERTFDRDDAGRRYPQQHWGYAYLTDEEQRPGYAALDDMEQYR